MESYTVTPLMAVGWEGFFGTISVLALFPILSIPSISRLSPFFDLPRGWYQMIDTPSVLYSGLVICVSISLFNFFGLSVTRHVSATARSLTDTCRTLAIWIVSLFLGWEVLVWPTSLLQVAGFALLVYGTFLFNDLVKPPPFLPHPSHGATAAAPAHDLEADSDEREGLLSSDPRRGSREEVLDETALLPSDLGRSGFDVVPEGQHVAGVHHLAAKDQQTKRSD
jgi:hypothetical protein